MLQKQRQIVSTVDNQIEIEDLVCTKYASTSFHSIDWMIISVNVTIYRTILLQSMKVIVIR
jgi:hypothetical protein